MAMAMYRSLCALAAAIILAVLPGCSPWPKPDEKFAATLPEEEPSEVAPNDAIFHTGHDVPLFENTVAHRVGDVLTITLEEQTNASKSAAPTTKKPSPEAVAAPALLGAPLTVHGKDILSNNLNDATTFDGEGNS